MDFENQRLKQNYLRNFNLKTLAESLSYIISSQ